MKEKKCQCEHLLLCKTIYVHLYGCPETNEYKEYQKLKWYQKLFKQNPERLYSDLFKV